MGTGSSTGSKVTYTTLSADTEEARQGFAQAKTRVKQSLGRAWPLFIGGVSRETDATTPSESPIDTRVVVGHVARARPDDVTDAIRAARAAFPAWRRLAWEKRVEILARAAEHVRQRRHELAVWMMVEMGKTRLEALGEVEELADLIDYYNAQMAAHRGYVVPMGTLSDAETNTSVLRPHGVWAVIAPWNFPMALLGAPIAAALVTGNTVVAKPSSETPVCGALVAQIFLDAGLPEGVLSFITGGGRVFGEAIANSPDVDGLTFTGSYDVGFHQLYRRFSAVYPRPCIVEMGGKNPAIVTEHADLEKATQGIHRSAFGMNGHKCSACSRVYVHERVADEFVARLTAAARATTIGDPLEETVFAGPLATRGGFEDYQRFVGLAAQAGAIAEGGTLLRGEPFDRGYFVRPTILTGLPDDHELVTSELFVPIVSVRRVSTLDEALHLANATPFGLTAGLFSREQGEIDQFLDRIEAGVVYVNRAAGATTGAWPGVQPFGGWKASGSSGKNIGGVYTLPCYLREQSRTLIG
jgi:1-pyrroline-5-carboxylate dehydrogenase